MPKFCIYTYIIINRRYIENIMLKIQNKKYNNTLIKNFLRNQKMIELNNI